MIGRVFRYTVRKICHADNARAETLADSESALTLLVKKMELFSSSDVQRHSILLNRRCRTAPVDNGKLRRPTRCRYDSLLNFLFITHEGPPLQIAALPGGRWPGAAHLIPGKAKLKYLYLCIPCLQLVEKPGCTLRSNRVLTGSSSPFHSLWGVPCRLPQSSCQDFSPGTAPWRGMHRPECSNSKSPAFRSTPPA